MKIDVDYNIGDKVRINVLEDLPGRVVSIDVTKYGVKYEVRYFYDCQSRCVLFYGDELTPVKEDK